MTEAEKNQTWIANIIASCTNQFHIDGCEILIELFLTKFGDDQLADDLRLLKTRRYNEIHNILN